MIYNSEFIWLHFPKCAGTKIETIFRKYFSNRSDIHQDPSTIDLDPEVKWHHTIAARTQYDPAFRLDDRVLICCFRKLPHWLESRYNYEVQRNPQFAHDPMLLLKGQFLGPDGTIRSADTLAKSYLPPRILTYHRLRLIRTEFFESDFKRAFGELIDISAIPETEFSQKSNRSRPALTQSLHATLSSSPDVYAHCPYWTQIEKSLYGAPSSH